MRLDLDAFIQRVRMADRRALLLDYDGTLAPFRVERDQAVPYDGVREVLTTIIQSQRTRLVVISGRSVHDLMPLLGIDPLPEIWGTHGWERRLSDGTYYGPDLGASAATGLAKALIWVEQANLVNYCEPKAASLALHWRGLDPVEAERIALAARRGWLPLVEASGLALRPFDGGVELSVPGKDKGLAVRTILEELNTSAVVAFLGDDRTDEDAFEAIKGKGLGVLVRPELRPTAASVWLRPPEELLAFLAHWQ